MKQDAEPVSGRQETIRQVLSFLGSYRFLMLFSLLLAAASVAMTLYVPILIGQAIDCIAGKGDIQWDRLTNRLILIGILVIATALLQWIMNNVNNRITFQVVRDVRREAFDRIQTLPLSYLDSHAHGDIVSRIIADVDQFSDGLLMGFTQFFTGILTILGTLIFMLILHPGITLLVVLLTPLSLFVARFISSRTYQMFKAQSVTRGEQTTVIEEMIGNQKVVQAFAYEDEALKQFDEVNDRLTDCALRATFYSSLTNPATRFVNSTVYAVVTLSGAFAVINGALTVGGLSSFLSYAGQYAKPFNEISSVITELQNAIACAGRVFSFINAGPDYVIPESDDTAPAFSGEVTFSHVDFAYLPEQRLIEDLNLHVESGKRIAIVGPTGCGKTTLINLLMRFYDVRSGSLKIDGTDISDIPVWQLRRNIGMVLQETWLKEGTIRENITMGKPDATYEEILAASRASHAHSFIKRLPDGYNTMITENGGGLSQGQQQLLCITRVMLCLPPMLILDEATSSIDTRTELKIQDAFNTMMKGRTSFIVAHRLSTIRNADHILVMRDGHIVEQGTYDELMALKGQYYHMEQSAVTESAQ